jgi:hypothetical protein
VEFTANPTDAYPTSLTGQRSVEDGDIIEATAIVLVPWQDDGGGDGLEARRSQAARAIFVDGVARGVAANLLPVAMLALTGNTLVWVDAPMVRRELGADRSDLPGLDIAPRALRLAYLMQHQSHLAELLTRNGRGAPASSWFSALPPAGPLPPNLINPADFTQSYFPAPVDVDFSIIPEDELPALLEESLALPPIDLLADADTLDSTAVLVLAPVPRNQWRAVISRLESLTRRIKPAAPNQVSARKPLEILQRLKLPVVLATPLDPTSPSDAEWQRLARLPNLWYVRRRNLAYREDVAGSALRLAGREVALEADFLIKLNTLGLKKTLDAALKRATPAAQNEIKNLLSSPKFADSAALTAVTLGELTRAATLDQSAVLQAASAVTEADSGAGLARLENATDIGSNAAALAKLTADADWKSLDVSAKKSAADNVSELVANIGAKPVVNTAFTPVSRLVLNRPK